MDEVAGALMAWMVITLLSGPAYVNSELDAWKQCLPPPGHVSNIMQTKTGIECAILKKGRVERRYRS